MSCVYLFAVSVGAGKTVKRHSLTLFLDRFLRLRGISASSSSSTLVVLVAESSSFVSKE